MAAIGLIKSIVNLINSRIYSVHRSSLLAKEGSLLTAERTGIITAERTGVLAPAVERGYKSNKPRGRAHCQQLDLALHSQTKKLNILLLSNKFNSLSQRVSLELEQQGHTTHVSEPAGELDMIETAKKVSRHLKLSHIF